MRDDIKSLSEQELSDLISSAAKLLENKRNSKKRDVIARIKELAESIDVDVKLIEGAEKGVQRKGLPVAIKYRDPSNMSHKWTGRGIKPRWLQAYLEQGRTIDEFVV